MRLILIRHGQSGNNLIWEQTGGSVGRHPDTPLTDRGHEQARKLADAVADGVLPWRIGALYCSLMTRAVQTAAPLADALDLPLRHLDIFESDGPYDEDPATGARTPHAGAGRTALLGLSRRLELADDVDESGWWRGDVENADGRLARATRVLAEVRQRHASVWPTDSGTAGGSAARDAVALVTHGHFTQYLLRAFLSIDTIGGWIDIDNTSVTLLEEQAAYDNTPVAVRINWTPHLTEAERTT